MKNKQLLPPPVISFQLKALNATKQDRVLAQIRGWKSVSSAEKSFPTIAVGRLAQFWTLKLRRGDRALAKRIVACLKRRPEVKNAEIIPERWLNSDTLVTTRDPQKRR